MAQYALAAWVALLPFAHNPALSVAADGTVVVYHIGSGTTPRSKQGNCSGGISGLDTNGTRAWCAASLLDAQVAAPAPRAGTSAATTVRWRGFLFRSRLCVVSLT
eukprot:COSAG04_NODE_12920_length_628_cov_1.434783_2_plen_105_part_00